MITDMNPPVDWERIVQQERIKKGELYKKISKLEAEINELKHQLRKAGESARMD